MLFEEEKNEQVDKKEENKQLRETLFFKRKTCFKDAPSEQLALANE